jgi:hypothetical protein
MQLVSIKYIIYLPCNTSIVTISNNKRLKVGDQYDLYDILLYDEL